MALEVCSKEREREKEKNEKKKVLFAIRPIHRSIVGREGKQSKEKRITTTTTVEQCHCCMKVTLI